MVLAPCCRLLVRQCWSRGVGEIMIYDEIAMNNGVIFQRAVDILNNKMQCGVINLTLESSGTDGKAALDAALLVPIAVNSAFACELFIKSMLPPNTKGHKLDDLFTLLNSDIQERIKSLTIEKMKKLKSTYCDADFQGDLLHHNNIFVEWRYFHEGKSDSVNIQFVLALTKSTFEIVNEERKK